MDVDLTSINSLAELHERLDKEALDYERRRSIVDYFVAYRNQTTDTDEKQKAQWEVEAFIFWFNNGKVFSFGYAPGQTPGEVQDYPDLEQFQQRAFDYLKQRAETSTNPRMLARYNHLLWTGPKTIKRKPFAYAAIENYIKVIAHFEAVNDEKDDGEASHEISHYAEKLIALTNEVKEKDEITKPVIARLLANPHIKFFALHSIIEEMVKRKGLFKPADLVSIPAIFEAELKKQFVGGDLFLWTRNYFKTVIDVAQKTGADIKYWHGRKGDTYATIGDRETEESRLWLKYDAYVSAAQAYLAAGDKIKKAAMEQRIFELKDQVKLPTITIQRTDEEIKRLKRLEKFIKAQANSILNQPPAAVYRSLIDGWFYPSKTTIENAMGKTKYLYEEYLTPVFFDQNKNIKKAPKEDHSQKKFYDRYHSYIDMVTSGVLFYVLVTGIRSGHLKFENFIAYLNDETWIGEPYLKTNLGGKEVGINWLSLLAPSLLEYFRQVQSWQWADNYTPNFIMPIDSLTLKMEGLLRNFCERMKISTTVAVKDGTQEGYIHNILDNETLNTYYSEDDRQYFKYLFANEGGINLRNSVAHCYYNVGNYDLDKMHFLIAALIKIGQFGIDHEQNNGNAATE